jgi:hypothetical protein
VNADEADILRIRDEIRSSRRMTDLERLQWLDELRIFTLMVRLAPDVPCVQAAVVSEPHVNYDSQKEG